MNTKTTAAPVQFMTRVKLPVSENEKMYVIKDAERRLILHLQNTPNLQPEQSEAMQEEVWRLCRAQLG